MSMTTPESVLAKRHMFAGFRIVSVLYRTRKIPAGVFNCGKRVHIAHEVCFSAYISLK
jgi:hypothetical protein